MKATVYLRISEDRTGLEAGVTRQREDCERRAAERGWDVTAVHVDNDVSAAGKRQRPGFEALLGDLAAGRADVVVAWSLDRLQRNRRDELRLYELCRERGAALSLVNGPDVDFTTAMGRYVADSIGGIARLEIEQKGERQQRAQRQAAEQGKRVGGRRPFGYEADGVKVRKDEAAAIRQAYDDLLSGVPLAAVARHWNAAGLTTGQIGWRTGEPGKWRRDNVRAVLTNPRYAGLRAYRGEIIAPAQWRPLVAEDTWRAVQGLLSDPSRAKGGGVRRLLSGLAFCGVCGVESGVTVHAGGATHEYPMYRCSASYGHVGRRAEPVEEYVAMVIVERLSRPDAVELMRDGERPDVEALRAQARMLRGRLDGLALEFADGELTASQLRVATERLRARLADVEAKMADAGRVNVLGPLVGADDVRKAWDRLDVDRRRTVVETLCQVVIHPAGRGTRTFRPETVGIEWRRP